MTVAQSWRIRSWNFGSAIPACKLVTSFSITGLGVPFGTQKPCQMPTSKLLKPDSVHGGQFWQRGYAVQAGNGVGLDLVAIDLLSGIGRLVAQ